MREVTVAATQMACSWEIDDNVARAERLVREAARRGAQVVLLQELFETLLLHRGAIEALRARAPARRQPVH